MIECDAVVTFDRVDGFRVVRSFGYVSGAAARRRNRLNETFRSLGVLIGLSPTQWTTDAEALRSGALDILRRAASECGANAVINLQFHAAERGDACEVIAFGEAVTLEKEGVSQS